MKLEFDINSAPPTHEEITAERERALKALEDLRKKDIRYIVVAVAILIGIVCFQLFVTIPAMRDPKAEPGFIGVVTLYTPYIIGAFIFTAHALNHKLIEKPRKVQRTLRDALTAASPEQLAETLGRETPYAEIAAYQQQVAAQGRALVQGELEMMQRWIEQRRSAES
ncbi:MAG TPA: hypothetical protein ENJ19_04435 [Gammaproteobacteria bacterium]|nr:hypothetical protein [Gammaproteobacteria bacterium]